MSLQDSRLFHWHYDELEDRNFRVKGHELLFLLPVLAALLCVPLLCFCLRRACRRGGSADSTTEGVEQGMDVEAVRKLPVRRHRGEAAVCSICLGVVVDGEKERPLPVCGHWFHPECIEEWLKKQSNCPLCRANIVRGGNKETSPPHPPPFQGTEEVI
ncbi:hypothetical protein HPP92_015065 [Vanilla planifolia]|uniref:RING-type domain-containing protein n=1 Tax=Vanilla planifolia TaxID=51239 RepID=A0A835QSQ8_VANPL|nr:hypothetical protein HPP92_015065 [Vanilla planifolia]